jgi:hypothetical protein
VPLICSRTFGAIFLARAMIRYEGIAVATDLYPLILLAIALGFLIFLMMLAIETLSVQSRHLRQMTRQLRELSDVVRKLQSHGENEAEESNILMCEKNVQAGDDIERSPQRYFEKRNRAA